MEINDKAERLRELKKLIETYEWDIKMNQFPPGKKGYLDSLKQEYEELNSASLAKEEQDTPPKTEANIMPPEL